MNAIRRRLLRWGAGRLATAIHARGARATHVLAFSDVIGDDPAVIGSAPCTPDPLLSSTVLGLCDAFQLRSVFPAPIARALGLAGSDHVAVVPPATSHPAFERVSYEVIASNAEAQRAAVHAAKNVGILIAEMVDVPLEGGAEPLGGAIAQIALAMARRHDGAALLVFGGEPTVEHMHNHWRVFGDDDADLPDDSTSATLADDDPAQTYERLLRPPQPGDPSRGEAPLGGRMQALALAAALTLDGAAANTDDAQRITILAAGTDGRDGPTDAAGAIVDANSALLIRRAGRDPARDLQRLRSYRALDAAHALLRTGPTGTNVMDIVLVFMRAATPRDRKATAGPDDATPVIMMPGRNPRRV
jgi:hydroxypyruvate reductase